MKTISLKNLKDGLNRDEMRAVKGGCVGGSGSYRCCWNGTYICSSCNGYTGCVQGAYLMNC
jgi:hypothetical protein